MHRTLTAALLALTFAACTDEPVPTCEVAVNHFYDQGCAITIPGSGTYPRADALALCAAPSKGDDCQDELDAYLICINETDASCGCQAEFTAQLNCQ